MIIYESKPLFAWDALEDSPTIKTIREFLEAVTFGFGGYRRMSKPLQNSTLQPVRLPRSGMIPKGLRQKSNVAPPMAMGFIAVS